MRKYIYSGPMIGREHLLVYYLQAKDFIEQHGIDDYVLEMRQPTPMGGLSLVLTSKSELDKGYIGYRGFLDHPDLCRIIDRSR